MIYFKKLRWKNLLSTGNVFTEINLGSTATTLIVGANGAGKSTILDALTFGLFGKPFRKINKPQLVNTIIDKQLVVEIEFSIGTIEYMIVRGIKPTIFEVYQNGSLLNQSAEMADYQEILEKQILKVNYKSFCQVVVLGTATFQPFMQLTAAQRREVIEDILGLQIFTTMNSLLKDKVLANKDEMNNVITDRKIIESKIEMTKQHLLEMQNNNEKIIEDKIVVIEENKLKVKTLLDELECSLDKINDLKNKTASSDQLNKKLNKMSKIRHEIEAKLKILQTEMKFFSDNETCPTCNQDINEDFRDNKITEKRKEIKKIEDGLKSLSVEYNTINDQLKSSMKLLDQLRDNEMDRIRISSTIRSTNDYISKLEDDINKIKSNQNISSDTKIEDFQRESELIEVRYNELSEQKNLFSFTSTLLKDDGIKAKIIKQYIPIINKLINKYLSEFELFCEFELDESFNEKIKSRYRDTFSYSSFSEGEKQKIDLALLFTWRSIAKLRNSINTNLLIFDEILDSSLDNNSVNYLMNVVNDVAKDNNIVIISHKDQMTEKFQNVIKFVKNKNFSQIQE